MATHSSTLAWKIPWTEEPGRLQFMGLQRIGDDLATEHAHHKLFFLNLFENFVRLKMNFENRIKFYFSSSFTLPFKGSQPLGQWDVRPSLFVFRSGQFCSVAQLCLRLFATPWTAAHQASLPSPTPGACSNSCPLSQWCQPTVSSFVVPFSSRPQSFPASGSFPVSQFFTSGGPKYWSFSFSISPSNDYSVLISFRIDWLDLLAIQGTLKSLLQHHSSKASILWRSAFFMVQLPHSYMTTGKSRALTRWTFVGKVMSLLFNMLSR